MLRHIPRQTADVKVEMDDLFLMIRDVSRHVRALSASRLRFSLSPAVLISFFFFSYSHLKSLPIFLGAARVLTLHDIPLHYFRNVYGRGGSASGRSYGDWGVLSW